MRPAERLTHRVSPGTTVAVAIIVVVAAATVWVTIDRTPPEWDHANHLERAVHCAGDLARGDWRAVLDRSSFYPPLVPCAAALAYRLSPSDALAAQSVVWVFLLIGAVATGVVARDVAGDAAGALAAVVFVTAPFTIFLALRFQLDLPLASMVAVFLLALTRAADFRAAGPALLVGLAFALGMLTKPTFAVYAAPVGALVVLARARGRRAVAHVALAALVGLALSVPWYGPRLFGLSGQVSRRSFEQAAESGYASVLSFAGLAFYPTWVISQFGVVATALLVLGVVVALKRRWWWLLTALVAPFVLVELVQNKNLRYTIPIFPAAAIVAGVGFSALPARGRPVVAALAGIAAVLQLAMTAAGWPPPPTLPVLGVPVVLGSAPTFGDWRQREILDAIARDRRAAGGRDPVRISVVPNHAYFSVSNFRYYALRDGRAMEFTRAWDQTPIAVDYMILKTGDVGPEWTQARPRRIDARLAADRSLARVFPVLGAFPLPDRSTATVRVRRIPDVDIAPAALAEEIEAAFRRWLPAVARDVEGLTVRLPSQAEIRGGRLGRVDIRARSALLGEFERANRSALRLRDVRLALEDVLVNPLAAHVDHRLEILDVARFRIDQATLTAGDLDAFLAGERRTRPMRITLREGYADFALVQAGPDVTARVRLVAAPDRPFAILSDHVRLAGVPVPDALVDWVVRGLDPSRRIASRLPLAVEIGDVRIASDAIRIGGPR